MTIVTSHSCFQLWWVWTAIDFGSNFVCFLAVKQVGTVLYLCILAPLTVKQVLTVWKFFKCNTDCSITGCWMYPPRFGKFFGFISEFSTKSCGIYPPILVEFWENLLFHVLSNDACKFAIHLFPIMWGPFENVHLLYFLLQIQIWKGCDVINIAANPIKDINVNLSFLSSWWTVVEYTPPDWKFLLLHLWV